MTQEAGVPRDFWGRIQQMIDDAVAKLARSGMLRNASISGGALTIKEGGTLQARYPASLGGGVAVWFGDVDGAITGTDFGTGMLIQGPDGTNMAAFYWDVDSDGPVIELRDGSGNVAFATDLLSGQGVARPALSGGFAATQFANFTCSTTSATYVTVADQWVAKQQPQLEVFVRAAMDTAGTTGELRVMVDGVQLGATSAKSFTVSSAQFSGAVAGAHMDLMRVEVQARVTSGSGALRVEPMYWRGRQS